MLRACCVCGDERKTDVGSGNAGKLDLCLFSGFLESLHGHLVAAKVDAVFSLEAVCKPVHNSLVEVVAA